MSEVDLALLSHKIDEARLDIVDLVKDVESVDDRITGFSDRLNDVEYWKNGNGGRGAEVRLQEVEDTVQTLLRISSASRPDDEIQRIAKVTATTIVENAREKDRTAVARVRAWAPYFVAGVGFLTGLIGLFR